MSVIPHQSRAGRRGEIGTRLTTLACYWLRIYPAVRHELDRWRLRTRAISHPVLRDIAHGTLTKEGLNAEGAALFAILAPRSQRHATTILLVRFQILYDYLDALTERRVPDPVRTSFQLHRSLTAALGGCAPAEDYFAHHPHGDDGGYLAELVAGCRVIFCALPGAARFAPYVMHAATRAAEGQSQSHAATFTTPDRLVAWARGTTPIGSGLLWWETAAASESSLGVHALLASAADARMTAQDAELIAAAYWPWITGLNALLDDLIDAVEDAAEGTHSYVERYTSSHVAALRLGAIAAHARRAIHGLPLQHRHATILAAMTSFYLAAPHAADEAIDPIARQVRKEIGYDLRPMLAMVRMRRVIASRRTHRDGSTHG